jgi:hypothetical protein
MIVARPAPGSLLFVTQPDHARFAGELLSLWRTEGLPGHPRRAEILFAAREHDNGWREADSAPRWDRERGRPHDFVSMPRPDRIEIWERGTARFAGEHPYATLLIVRHALQLHQDRFRQADETEGEVWAGFQEYLEELQRGLLEALEATEAAGAAPEEVRAEVEADYRWIDLSDLISLAVCNRWTEPFARHGMRGGLAGLPAIAEPLRLALDPFPLAGATTFRIPCRRIADRPYAGDADLAVELARTRWEEMEVKVVGPESFGAESFSVGL